jgi:hypothetical protein
MIKSYGEMKILEEGWTRRVSAEANQQELITKMWAGERRRISQGRNYGHLSKGGGRLLTSNQQSLAGRSSQSNKLRVALPVSYFFHIFEFFFFGIMKKFGDELAFWENGCIAFPFFEPCPYTWKGEIFHSSWSLEIPFFFKFLFC